MTEQCPNCGEPGDHTVRPEHDGATGYFTCERAMTETNYPPIPEWWVECDPDDAPKIAMPGDDTWCRQIGHGDKDPDPRWKGIRPMTEQEAFKYWFAIPHEYGLTRAFHAGIEYEKAKQEGYK